MVNDWVNGETDIGCDILNKMEPIIDPYTGTQW